MARSARRYDLYLPLAYNDGRPVEDGKFDTVERRLLAHFGGLTTQMRDFPLRGIWQGETRLYYDQVVIMTVLDFRRRGSTRFVKQLKKELLREFDQLEILLTESALRVH
jgi:mRNA-degrading endonuclease YafQ of YafQ-DinJ toxin-antitoxin module